MTRKLRVLLVEDNPDLIHLFQREFEGHGHALDIARSVPEAIRLSNVLENERRFTYAIVDIHLGHERDSAGLIVLNVLRETASHRTLACALTGDTSEGTIRAATEAGARIVFPKPISPHVLRLQFEGSDLEEVIGQATHSEATNLLNYKRFKEMVLVDIRFALEARAEGVEKSFCLLSMDADDFGRINKVYSHRTGDNALKVIGRILEDRFRFGDWICHKSGDEFLVWLRGTRLESALAVAAHLEERIASAEVRHSDGQLVPIGISAGVTEVDLEEMRNLTNAERVSYLMEQAEVGPYGLNKVKERKKKANHRG